MGFPDSSVGKESACNVEDLGLIPGLGRSAGEGIGYPLQYSGLENSLDCIVHEVAKGRTRLSNFHFHLVFDVSVISRLMAILHREMDELTNEDFRDEITTLMDRKTFSIREKEKVWYQNGNKMKSLLMKVKEESEKVGSKLNIQKMKILASNPITSW